jgi:kinesin family protein 3/17
VDTE